MELSDWSLPKASFWAIACAASLIWGKTLIFFCWNADAPFLFDNGSLTDIKTKALLNERRHLLRANVNDVA